MKMSEGTLRTVATVALALATSAVLDVVFEPPVLVRWAIVVAVVLLVGLVVEVLRRRVDAPRAGRDTSTGAPQGRHPTR